MQPTNNSLAIRFWFQTIITYVLLLFACLNFIESVDSETALKLMIVTGLSFTVGLPALILLFVGIWLIKKYCSRPQTRTHLFTVFVLFMGITYGVALTGLDEYLLNITGNNTDLKTRAILCTGCVLGGVVITRLRLVYRVNQVFNYQHIKKRNKMDKNDSVSQDVNENPAIETKTSNRLLVKAVIVGGLILAMLIPMIFLEGLVDERKTRKEEVVTEVSSKWAGRQCISNPYLMIPYTQNITNDKGGVVAVKKYLAILPEDNTVKGVLIPEIRKRSIYQVPLYHTNVTMSGYFNLSQIAKYVPLSVIDFANTKVCLGLSEFKGIEKAISIRLNDSNFNMLAGLPHSSVHQDGVSTPITLSIDKLTNKLSYKLNLNVKGSAELMFEPLSGNSQFYLSGSWPAPSFTGNQLPATKLVTDTGFNATWNFNQANLPFDLILPDKNITKTDLSFGVSLVQPVDSYSQTNRSIKYAILIIGLTFALFFIIEIMQKNAFHPIQYLLVGLALSVFYTLLLSISEFLNFSFAYLIASSATIGLIAFYAYTHFKNAKTSFVFSVFMSLLYAFIYVLLTLEDTALLAGSVALFFILAVVMYVTRKINWYKL